MGVKNPYLEFQSFLPAPLNFCHVWILTSKNLFIFIMLLQQAVTEACYFLLLIFGASNLSNCLFKETKPTQILTELSDIRVAQWVMQAPDYHGRRINGKKKGQASFLSLSVSLTLIFLERSSKLMAYCEVQRKIAVMVRRSKLTVARKRHVNSILKSLRLYAKPSFSTSSLRALCQASLCKPCFKWTRQTLMATTFS